MKLVIFDVDGTLVDSQAHIMASMEAGFSAANLPVPARQEVLAIVGLSLPLAMRELARDVDDETIATMVAAYKDAFQAHRLKVGAQASPLYPGAEAAIRRLGARDDVLLAIATGKSRRGLKALMEGWDFAPLFISTQCADDHPSKPHPSMVMACLAEAGVAAKDAVVVGDTTYDMEMARAAMVAPIGVNWGYHGVDALHATGARVVIDTFDALDGALAQIWRG